MAFVSLLQVFYEMRFLCCVFILLYTEDFSMRHYVGFSQIGSHIYRKYHIVGKFDGVKVWRIDSF